MVSIGIDLGGTNIKIALVDREKGFIDSVSIPTRAELGKDQIFDSIKEQVLELTDKNSADPMGVGMGLPGMVSLDRRTVSNPPNLPGWKKEDVASEIEKRLNLRCTIDNDANLAALGSARFGVASEIEKRLNLRCTIDNDANLAALGSARFGVAKPFDSFIMITLGTGVGGGIIYENKIYRGTTGSAGELGHVIIDYHGPLSNSNTRGGIEAYLGQRFLSRFAIDLINQQPDNPLYKEFHKDFDLLEPVDLTRAANNGNELAIDILRKSGEKLGFAIVNYIHILDIRKIVVSGGVAKAGKWILDPAKETARKLLMPPFLDGFDVIYESLGNEAALLGAASLAFEELS